MTQTRLGIFFSNDFPVEAFTFWDDESCQDCYKELIEKNIDVTIAQAGPGLALSVRDVLVFEQGQVLLYDTEANIQILEKEVFKELYFTLPGLEDLGISNFPSWIKKGKMSDEDHDDGETALKSFPIVMNQEFLDTDLKDWTQKQDLYLALAGCDWPAGHVSKGVHIMVDDQDFVFDVQWTTKGPLKKVFLFFIERLSHEQSVFWNMEDKE